MQSPHEDLESRIRANAFVATTWLGRLRAVEPDSLELLSDLAHLRAAVSRDTVSLAYIGTSEEELEMFEIRGHKALASEYLKQLRAGNPRVGYRELYWEIEGRGFELADIGTTKQEVEGFCVKARMVDIQEWFNRSRKDAAARKSLADWNKTWSYHCRLGGRH